MKMSPLRKRQRLHESESVENLAQNNLPHLPNEMWCEIFKHNSTKDLLNLSLVCKNFYGVIGNSPDTMEKMKLRLNSRMNVEEILHCGRKYSNVVCEGGAEMIDCARIFERYGPTLRALEIDCIGFSQKDLIDILRISRGSLRELTIKNLTTLNTAIERNLFVSALRNLRERIQSINQSNSFKLTKLEKFTVALYSSDMILRALQDFLPDTISELNYYSYTNETEALVRFLESQKNLKILKLDLKHQFLNTIDVTKIQFGLETFEYFQIFNQILNEGISNFLKSQAGTLKCLKLKNVPLADLESSFEYMPNLLMLEIELREQFYQDNNGPNFFCPVLRKLKISFHHCGRNFSSLKFLKRLPKVNTVAEIQYCDSRFFDAFAKNHPTIKKLVVLSPFKDLDLDNATTSMENLKVLKLGSKVSMQSLLWILVNFKKLKHLEIRDGSKLSDVLLCRITQYFKDLSFLKINKLREHSSFAASLAEIPTLKVSISKDGVSHPFSWSDNFNDYEDSSDDDQEI